MVSAQKMRKNKWVPSASTEVAEVGHGLDQQIGTGTWSSKVPPWCRPKDKDEHGMVGTVTNLSGQMMNMSWLGQ